MKTISLWQPWATLIALNEKRCETRSWRTDYRGPLAIHAAKRFHQEQRDLFGENPFAMVLADHGVTASNAVHWNFPFGAIVAVCDLVDVVPTSRMVGQGWLSRGSGGWYPAVYERDFGDYHEGRFGWILKNIKACSHPVLCRGEQGLFDLPEDVLAKVRAETDYELVNKVK